VPISIPLKLCLYLVSFLRCSASKNGVTLKLSVWSFKVIENSRSLKMAPFDRSFSTFYWSAIVSIALSSTVCEIFDVE